MIYFDYNASTPIAPEVKDLINDYYNNRMGYTSNINSKLGINTTKIVSKSKKVFKKLISSSTINEIIFTSGATESINTAIISSVLRKNRKQNVILTTRIEHKSILSTCKFTERFGIKTEYVDIDSNGSINIDSLKDKINDNALMFATHHVNNEIGTIQPMLDIGEICKNNKILFLVDAAQSLGKIPINVKESNISFLAGSSHKIYGPQGIGVLYVHNDYLRGFVPLIHGGGQQGNIRSGTLNFVGIIGFTKAIELTFERMMDDKNHVCYLKDIFLSQLDKHKIIYSINGHTINRIYGNLNIRFVGVDADYLLLSCPNITMSKGSACESDSITPSHVLRAIGMCDQDINESIRISFGRHTTEKEIIDSVSIISNSINDYFKREDKGLV